MFTKTSQIQKLNKLKQPHPQKQQQVQQLTDCISAKQLLQALSTLQQISTQQNVVNQLQLSFSQSSHSFFNTNTYNCLQVQNQCSMGFQMYMDMKNNSKVNKNDNKKKDKKVVKSIKKSVNQQNIEENRFAKKLNPNINATSSSKLQITPTKIKTPHKQSTIQFPISSKKAHNNQANQFKSRSHSPLNSALTHSPLSKNLNNNFQFKKSSCRLSIPNQSSLSYVSSRLQNSNTTRNNIKDRKENKQNLQQIPETATVKVSQNSKKILNQRQKNGKSYVPIHQRTNQLIRQKQQKIAKLQRISLAEKQIQQRECTFKPSINQHKNVPKLQNQPIPNRHRVHTTIDYSINQQPIIVSSSDIRSSLQLVQSHSIQKLTKQKTCRQSTNNQIGHHQSNTQNLHKNQKNLNSLHNHKITNSKCNIVLDLI